MDRRELILIIAAIAFSFNLSAQTGNFSEVEGKLLKDNQPYSGEYIVTKEDNQKSVFNFRDGFKQGEVKHYYTSGAMKESGSYKSGEKDGTWLKWDEEGNKIGEAHYRNGNKSGSWLVWDSKGTKRYEMYYSNGEKTGNWKIWDENGVLTQERSF